MRTLGRISYRPRKSRKLEPLSISEPILSEAFCLIVTPRESGLPIFSCSVDDLLTCLIGVRGVEGTGGHPRHQDRQWVKVNPNCVMSSLNSNREHGPFCGRFHRVMDTHTVGGVEGAYAGRDLLETQ